MTIKDIITRRSNVVFICQITEGFLKVVKCAIRGAFNKEIIGLEIEPLEPNTDDKKLADKLNLVFQRLGYGNSPVVLSLPRSQITCRNLKIPSKIPQEIEKIANLQAPRYLPYTSDELITGFQLIRTDKEGYSNILLVIAHKDIINRYASILKGLRPLKISIIPSSNGIADLYRHIKPLDSDTVMLVDIDLEVIEFVVVGDGKLLFSRSIRLGSFSDWENLFISEVNKTKEAYAKELNKEPIRRIVFMGPQRIASRCQEIINSQKDIPAEILSYIPKVKFLKGIEDKLIVSGNSFTSLIGLGLKEAPATLNLLPKDIKEKENKNLQVRLYLRLAALIASVIIIWAIALDKNVDNKQQYLERLKFELAKVSKEAIPLEDMEKKFKALENKNQKRVLILDYLHELYRVVPEQISLTNLIYEEGKITLRGETGELNSVLAFVSQLENSPVFKQFNIKMKYATQKKTQAGEVVGFEINCTNK